MGSNSGQGGASPKFERQKFERQNPQQEPEQKKTPPPDNVVPIRPGVLNQLSANLPWVGLLISLKNSPKFFLSVGKMLYARMKKEQDKSKLRKGIVLDIKA
jgi:hypothetical protein